MRKNFNVFHLLLKNKLYPWSFHVKIFPACLSLYLFIVFFHSPNKMSKMLTIILLRVSLYISNLKEHAKALQFSIGTKNRYAFICNCIFFIMFQIITTKYYYLKTCRWPKGFAGGRSSLSCVLVIFFWRALEGFNFTVLCNETLTLVTILLLLVELRSIILFFNMDLHSDFIFNLWFMFVLIHRVNWTQL